MISLKNVLFYHLLLLLSAFILVSCSHSYEQWQEEAITMAKSNNDITQEEYELLIEKINTSPEDFGNFLNDDQTINDENIRKSLLKLFSIRKIDISEESIFSPNLFISGKKIPKFNVNVYLENSASMDGYVNGKTEFETAIYSLLGDIKINGFSDSLNLFYINSKVHPFENPAIEDFIDKLEPSSFKARGGDRSKSDLSNAIKTIVSTVNKENASILISDFVFSPGKDNDALEFLNNQMIGIKLNLSEALKIQDNISAVVLHLESSFNGQYYDSKNIGHEYQGKRPYYILIIGTEEQIKQILATKILENIEGSVFHQFLLNKGNQSKKIEYKIAKSPKIGEFELNSGSQGPIESARPDRDKTKGVFSFTFYANFSNEMQSSEFFSDLTNYRWNSNYDLEISPITDKNNSSMAGYTHIFTVSTSELKSETFTLEVIGKIPIWIDSISSDNDVNISPANEQANKTFGFKYLMEGISQAFYPNNKENVLNKLEITIKR